MVVKDTQRYRFVHVDGLNFNQQDTASQWTLVTGMLGSVLPVTPLIDKDGD